jgi:hypothetical protein
MGQSVSKCENLGYYCYDCEDYFRLECNGTQPDIVTKEFKGRVLSFSKVESSSFFFFECADIKFLRHVGKALSKLMESFLQIE